MIKIEDALTDYYNAYNKYPINFDEFVNRKPIWSHWRRDSWDNKYRYDVKDSTEYILVSAGKDQEFDTEDDIVKTNKY